MVRIVSSYCFCFLLVGCALIPWGVEKAGFCSPVSDTNHRFFGKADSDHLVIFIHGFCGDGNGTWVNEETGFDFPKELAVDLNDAYIVSFNYISGLQGGPSILSIAKHLGFEIGELLKAHPYRTIRFVTHSMGGIVARQYILRDHTRSYPEVKATHLILLASPSNGSELAELKSLVPENRQVEEMRHIDKGNSYLESLNDDWNREFKALEHPRSILVYAGYEELRLPVVGKAVRLSSAIAYADKSLGFQKDHNGMAKPKDRTDDLYRWVKANVQEPVPPPPVTLEQRNSLIRVLRERSESGVSGIENVVKAIDSAGAPQSEESKLLMERLRDTKRRFLILHEKHVAAIRDGDIQSAHEITGKIHELLFEFRDIVDKRFGEIARKWQAILPNDYIESPEPGVDRAYDETTKAVGRLHQKTVSVSRSVVYPGQPPPGLSNELQDLFE